MDRDPLGAEGGGAEDFENAFAGEQGASKSTPPTPLNQRLADAALWRLIAILDWLGIYSTTLSRALDRALVRQEARNEQRD